MHTFKIAILLLTTMTAGFLGYCSSKNIEAATIQVPGLQCSMCKTNVQNSLQDIQGIDDFTVDLQAKSVTVTYQANVLQLQDIQKAIAAAGYDADNVQASEKARNQLASCCRSD